MIRGVVSNKTPVVRKQSGRHYNRFGVYRGIVIDVVYPSEGRNTDNQRLEYVVQINGQLFRGVVDIRQHGGIYNYSETIRTPSTKADKIEGYDQLGDGDQVYVCFVNGNSDIPIIIGSFQHSRHGEYRKASKADGNYSKSEYNGIEFYIDKNGTLTIKQVGLKNSDTGAIQNSAAIGAEIKIDGTTGAASIKDSAGNLFELNGTDVNITVTGAANITTGGPTTITSGGPVKIDATGDVTLKTSNIVNAGDIPSIVNNNDPITGIPLVAAGGIKAE